MFGKNKEQEIMSKPTPPISSSNKQEVNTLLSEGVKFEGNMFAPSNTRIDGEVKGNINGQSMLVIGEKGRISGDINAVDVVIYGQVDGNIKCHRLDLKKGSRLNGDIFVEVFMTESGMIFNGRCVMEQKKQTQPVTTTIPPKTDNK